MWRDHADKFKERVASKRDEIGEQVEAGRDVAKAHLKDAHDHIHPHFSRSQARIVNNNSGDSGDGSAEDPEENERVVPDVLSAYMQTTPEDMGGNFSANDPDLKKNKKPMD